MALQTLKQITIPTNVDTSNYYTKTEADDRFAAKGETGGTTDAYTKAEADDRFLTQADASSTYAQKSTTYTKTETTDAINTAIKGISTVANLAKTKGTLSGSGLTNGATLGSLTAPSAGTYLILWQARIGSLNGNGTTSASIVCNAGGGSFAAPCGVMVGGNATYDGSAQTCCGWAMVYMAANGRAYFEWQTTKSGGSITSGTGRTALIRIGD